MNTIDLEAAITSVEDLQRAVDYLSKDKGAEQAEICAEISFSGTFRAQANADGYTLKVAIYTSKTCRIIIDTPNQRTFQSDDYPLTAVPRNVSELYFDREPYYEPIAKSTLELLQIPYTEILNAFKAQSKEDFYDDTSDYQDDEPTDFGDASNYDEGLVHRIRKAIE